MKSLASFYRSKMNVSSQPLFASASQPSKLPIPRLPSIPTSSWTSSSTSTNPGKN